MSQPCSCTNYCQGQNSLYLECEDAEDTPICRLTLDEEPDDPDFSD